MKFLFRVRKTFRNWGQILNILYELNDTGNYTPKGTFFLHFLKIHLFL